MEAFSTKYGLMLTAGIVFIGGLCWSYHATYQKGWHAAIAHAQQQAQTQKEQAIATERKTNHTLQTKLEQIEHEKQQTMAANQSMHTELDRLQEYINPHKLPTTTGHTGQSESNATTRGWTLFGNCAKEYAGMAEVADNQRDALAQWQAYGAVVEGMK